MMFSTSGVYGTVPTGLPDLGQPQQNARGLRFEQWLVLIVAFLPATRPLFVEHGTIPLGTRTLAALVWVVALIPAWSYIGTPAGKRRPIPFMPIIGVLYGLYYAITVVLDQSSLNYATFIDPTKDYERAVEASLVCIVTIIIFYNITQRSIFVSIFENLISYRHPSIGWAFKLFFVGSAVRVLSAVSVMPSYLGAIATFVNTLGTFGAAVLIIQWRQKGISLRYRIALVAGLALMSVIEIGTGSVSTLAFLFTMIALSYWASSPDRLSLRLLTLIVLGAAFVIIVKGVIGDFRQQAWYSTSEVQYTLAERAGLVVSLIGQKISSEGVSGALSDGGDATAQRSSNADTLAEVMRRTPSEVPFWNGTSYSTLITSFIPRILWPNKPVKKLGQDFGHRYGFVGAQDFSTSFNLPWIVEGFANFGWFGIIGIGIVIGSISGWMDQLLNVPGQSAWTTAAGISVLAPLFNMESDFSLKYGGVPLTLVTFWLVFWWITSSRRRSRTSMAGA